MAEPGRNVGRARRREHRPAIERGYTDKALPYHGYFFKTLTSQGPAAPLGEMNFVVKGAMIGGFALVAAPADTRPYGREDLHRQPRRRRL